MIFITKQVHWREKEDDDFKENDGGCSRQSRKHNAHWRTETCKTTFLLLSFTIPQDIKAFHVQENSQVNQQ